MSKTIYTITWANGTTDKFSETEMVAMGRELNLTLNDRTLYKDGRPIGVITWVDGPIRNVSY